MYLIVESNTLEYYRKTKFLRKAIMLAEASPFRETIIIREIDGKFFAGKGRFSNKSVMVHSK